MNFGIFDTLTIIFTVVSTIILAINIVGLLAIMLVVLWNTF